MKKRIIWSNINLDIKDWEEDYKEWLEKFAKDSPIIHLQQTVLNSSNHSPFTEAFNSTGIIQGNEVIDILDKKNLSPELVLELSFREKHEVEPTIIKDLKESVDYWKKEIKTYLFHKWLLILKQ
jgi:hypothetical protein